MGTLMISRLHHRMTAPADVGASQLHPVASRLPTMLDEAVDAWSPPPGHVCVRSVRCSITVPRSALDNPSAVARRLAGEVVHSLDAALARQQGRHGSAGRDPLRRAGAATDNDIEVVWYRDVLEAVGDVVRRAASGDLGRRWAWQQVGVVRPGDPTSAPELLVDVLTRHPRVAPAALRWLAARRPGVISAWTWSEWWRIADAWFNDTGPATPRRAGAEREGQRDPKRSWPESGERLASAAAAVLRDADPTRRPRLADHVAALIAAAVHRGARPIAEHVAAARSALASHLEPCVELGAAHGGTGGRLRADAEPVPVDPGPDAMVSVADPVAAPTSFGGLPFVLNVLKPQVLDGVQPQALHRLAMRLTGAAPDDPAVLAFCGLLPDEDPPEPAGGPVSDEQQVWLDAMAAEVSSSIRARLGDRRPADLDDETLFAWLTFRNATVQGCPGWIEVNFALESADIDVRASGLDLDPGWVPWLGCAVRFSYA